MIKKKDSPRLLFSLSGILTLLACLPVLALIWTALQGNSDIWGHLLRYVLPPTLVDTTILLLGVGLLTILIGTGSAWLVTAYQFRGRAFLDWALLLPLAVPTYIIAYSYIDILHPIGPVQTVLGAWFGWEAQPWWFPNIRSVWGCIFLLSFVLYPYVYLSTRAMFLMQSASLIEVARSLGLKPNQVFLRVAIPLARPAIAVGASLALMETINDIGATEFLGVKTLTLSIYSTWINQSDLASAAQIAIFMLMIITLLVIVERLGRRKQRYMNSAQRSRLMPAQQVTGSKAWLFLGLGLIPICIGFLIPISHLLVESYKRFQYAGFSDYLLQASINTLSLASLATVITIFIGFLIVSAARFTQNTWFSRISSLGYAIPGTVLAIGLMLSLGKIDHAVADFLEFKLGIHTGLLFLGTTFTLIYAYCVRFLAIAIGGIESGYNRIHGVFDDAARNLGQNRFSILWRVHLPLLRPAIISAALLIFVDCMKELPATLLLRPLNMETLATQLYAEAARGTYEDGAIAALLIVLVGLIPVILLAKMGKNIQQQK
ncbi:iron ABC transporter permease [Acinetobacter haemolyticus]|uniref:ABC transporter, permease protein n=1 Tax=Acinetobacter haemolyticus ATCC 19194 TaxID=707232 RepID=D4XS58_ACIHA|nr:iron ABC transporter permease [Acinetobacter haemolyticus]EFF81965.1 ABC transporter, permease protein [Acinetobacter haemolyticus ATCC 19194]MQZ30171.1 iron ABC transporter permease [Acinetobacter haemolyticus]